MTDSLPRNGAAPMVEDLNMGSNQIDGTAPRHAVNKGRLDETAQYFSVDGDPDLPRNLEVTGDFEAGGQVVLAGVLAVTL